MFFKVIEDFKKLEQENANFRKEHQEKTDRLREEFNKAELRHKHFANKVQRSMSRYSK
ncbi:hypothetical protein [Streptococcus pluranimalium]|uniref:hypothetical protein n=1 Tax=Streptococcus pluranimalium TaxID=82348 RepID=UPI003F68FE66